MNSPRTVGQQFRDHLFVLAWVLAAVVAKYSVTFSNPETSSKMAPPSSVASVAPVGELAIDE